MHCYRHTEGFTLDELQSLGPKCDPNGTNQGHFYWTKHFHERISQFVSTCIWAYVCNFILYTLKGLDKIFAFVTCWHSTGSRVNETNFGAVDAPASWYMT